MSELKLDIYDFVKIVSGCGSIYLESINELNNATTCAQTDNFCINLSNGNVTYYDGDENFQLDMVWRKTDDYNYIIIYPANKLTEYEAIKNAKPKHYLKWEDLEFEVEHKDLPVLLNGSLYFLEYYSFKEDELVALKTSKVAIFGLEGSYINDKQFFNDLHLERVEE